MSEDVQTILETEWSHFINVNNLSGDETELTISPDADALKRLAGRLGVKSVDAIEATIKIARRFGEVSYHVTGTTKATLTQDCVVTLEPIKTTINDEFESFFADPDAAISIAKARQEKLSEKGHGEFPLLDEKEDPEPLVQDKIDLGELVTQYLSLSINPYPHAEGVDFENAMDPKDDEIDEAVQNPFAALKDWKDKLTGEES